MPVTESGPILRPKVRPIWQSVRNGATFSKIVTPFRTTAYSTEGEEYVMGHRVLFPSSVAFEQEVATRLHADFPQGWIVHDVYVGEEQIDVLAVVPHGIFAIECKAYHGQIVGDPNTSWVASTNDKATVLEPRQRNPYRQVLRKAFAVGDFLTAVMQAHPTLVVDERPWVHACVVVPQTADVSTVRGIAVNPRSLLPRGQGRAMVFHPDHLSAYICLMGAALDHDVAQALVLALGGAVDGTWIEHPPIQQALSRFPLPQAREGFRLQIVWEG
jgi:hypothetical protein